MPQFGRQQFARVRGMFAGTKGQRVRPHAKSHPDRVVSDFSPPRGDYREKRRLFRRNSATRRTGRRAVAVKKMSRAVRIKAFHFFVPLCPAIHRVRAVNSRDLRDRTRTIFTAGRWKATGANTGKDYKNVPITWRSGGRING